MVPRLLETPTSCLKQVVKLSSSPQRWRGSTLTSLCDHLDTKCDTSAGVASSAECACRDLILCMPLLDHRDFLRNHVAPGPTGISKTVSFDWDNMGSSLVCLTDSLAHPVVLWWYTCPLWGQAAVTSLSFFHRQPGWNPSPVQVWIRILAKILQQTHLSCRVSK